MAMMSELKKNYKAPITMGFTPSDGDIIGGTINGVEVNGQWIGESKYAILYRGGNADTYGGNNTNVPFCTIGFRNEKAVISLEQDSAPTTDYELHLYRYVPSDIVQIPQEYVEGLEATAADATEAKTTAKTAQSTANAAKTTAETAQSTANAAKTTANAAAPKENPEFTGTFSQNREPGSDIGNNSHAEGFSTTASGDASHAEGFYAMASGNTSHAEGTSTTASGDNSHAEGFSTTASGNNSHAEGFSTTASGACSHVEGDHTIASNGHVHVQGMYNLEDTAGRYLHIVGNGDSNARSNAHTIDMQGVPWYRGRPRFGGDSMDDGAQTVIGNGDKEIILSSSTPNSTKKFKITVDDTGAISATEVT